MHATSLELAHIGDASSRRGCELSLRPAKEGAGGAALGWYHHQCLGVAAVTTETDEVDVEFSTNDGGGWKKLIDGDSLGFVADRGARDRAKRRMDQGSPRLGDDVRNPFPLHRNGRVVNRWHANHRAAQVAEFVEGQMGHQHQPAVKAALDAWFDEVKKGR